MSWRSVSKILQRAMALILFSWTIRSTQCDWLISPLEIKPEMTLLLFLVTHTYKHRWQGIRLSCPFYYLPLSCCWISRFRLLCCGLRGISLIPLAAVFFHISIFSSLLFAFGLPLPSLHSFPLLFVCFGSIYLLMCRNVVGREEICHVITPCRPISLVFSLLLSVGLL